MNGRGGEWRPWRATDPSLAGPGHSRQPLPKQPPQAHGDGGQTGPRRVEAPPRPGCRADSASSSLHLWAPGTRDRRLLTLVTVLSPVAGRTLLPTLAADGVTGRARGTGTRLPAPRPEKAGLAGCRGRGERGLQGEPAQGRPAPPRPRAHRAGSAAPGSPPCRSSCRPSCRTPGCSAAHTGTPPSSQARRPTAGRLRPRSRERLAPARATPPGPGPRPPGLSRDPAQSWHCPPPEDRAAAPILQTRYKVSGKGGGWPWVTPPPAGQFLGSRVFSLNGPSLKHCEEPLGQSH